MEASASKKISFILGIRQGELERKSLETYLHIRLKRCESEIFKRDV
jgi:hypothetical protein